MLLSLLVSVLSFFHITFSTGCQEAGERLVLNPLRDDMEKQVVTKILLRVT